MIQVSWEAVGVSVAILTAVWGMISWLFKNTIMKELRANTEMTQKLSTAFHLFQVSCAKDLVLKEECEKDREAHKNMWGEHNSLRDRVSNVEGVIKSIQKE